MNIFFSWQSDLPLKNNKNFIEDCVKGAIKELNSEKNYMVDFKLDKDTSGEPGNPEIINLILDKIDKSRIFICDLSIINRDFSGKKTPNPNVIFELGYAIKSLGWEKIICIVNEEYGKIEELPFDIKHRRLLCYDLSVKEKKIEKRKIVNSIKSNIYILKERGLLFDELDDYLKKEIDTEFLTIFNHLRKIVLEKNDKNLLVDTGRLLGFKKEEMLESLKGKQVLGFHLFKNFGMNSKSVKLLIDKIIATSHFKKERLIVLIKFLEWVDWYNKFTDSRSFDDKLFIESGEAKGFKIIQSNNPELPNRFILGLILNSEQVKVYDFGDIVIRDKVEKSCSYFVINEIHLNNYSKLLYNFIEIAIEWLNKTGGEFIIDTFNQFEMK